MTPHENPTPRNRDQDFLSDSRVRLVGLVLALVTVVVYVPVCFHDWIFFDDPAYVLDNGVVQRGLTWAGLKWAFAGWHASNWHPLTWLSHMMDCQLFGVNPGPQHLVNVLFHAANSVLVFLLWKRMTKALWPSAFVAALFAWHPLHVESVAWIAERKDVLSTMFGLLTLLAYAERSKIQGSKSKVWYICAAGCFALGLLAKPMLVTLPCVMLLLDIWPLKRISGFGISSMIANSRVTEHGPRNTLPLVLLLEKAPFFLFSAISCAVTFLAQRQQAVLSFKQYSVGLRLENVVVAYGRYVFKTFWPAKLAVFYPLPEHFPAGVVAFAAVVLVGISAVAWWLRKRSPCVLIGWLWFLGMLVPVIGLVQVGSQAMADRYTYLPSIGLFVAVAFGIADARERLGLPVILVHIVALLVLVGCLALTERQLQFWRNTGTLFTRTLSVTKKNGPAHMMLGVWFERQGQQEEALREYQDGLKCDSSLVVQVAGGEKRSLAAQVQLLLGQAAEQKGEANNALAHYREALRLGPNLPEAHNNLGNLLDDLGKADEALASYQAAVRLRPQMPLAHENLGTQLVKLGRFDEAMKEYQEAARLAPGDPRPFYLIGKAELRRGQGANAVAAFEAALQRSPEDYQSLTFLARALAADENSNVRNGTRAVTAAEKANVLSGENQPFVLGSLAMAYAEAGRFEDARKSVAEALRLAGTNTEVLTNLQVQRRFYESNQPYRERPVTPPPH